MGSIAKSAGNVLKTTTGYNLLTGGSQPKARDLIDAQSKANQINQNTPFGSLTYGVDSTGRTTANYNPSQAFSGLASSLGNYAQNNLNDSLSLGEIRNNLNSAGASAKGIRTGLTELGNPDNLTANLGNFGSIDTSGLPNINQDFGAQSQQAQDAFYQSGQQLLRPQQDLQRRRTIQSLADQGLPISGEAYNGELNRLDTQQGLQNNQLAAQAIQAGNQRQNELYSQALQGNNQLFGQQSTMANLADSQRQQQFGENQGVFNAQAQNRNQLYNENQGIADFALRKQMGLAGLSNQNAAMAQQLLQPQQLGVQGVDAAGIINGVTANKNAATGQLLQTGGTLAAAAMMSDSRLKENISIAGEHNGFPLYEFNYKGETGRYRGVMAQDVEKIKPEAVVEMNGFKAVRYDMINVPFERVA